MLVLRRCCAACYLRHANSLGKNNHNKHAVPGHFKYDSFFSQSNCRIETLPVRYNIRTDTLYNCWYRGWGRVLWPSLLTYNIEVTHVSLPLILLRSKAALQCAPISIFKRKQKSWVVCLQWWHCDENCERQYCAKIALSEIVRCKGFQEILYTNVLRVKFYRSF